MSSPLKQNTETIQNLINQINTLPEASSGVELPTLTNEGSASDLLSGKQLIDSDGNVVTGIIATKTVSDLSASGAAVTVPSGYYASQATKTVSTAIQATPSVSIDANGKITATATQTSGYVSAGTKTANVQLAFQSAKTITPSTASQIAVSSGYYTGGNITVAAVPTQIKSVTPTSTTQNVTPDSGKFLSKVTVAGDSNLVAGNIKSGVSIFGVSGNYAGSGGDTSVEDSLITRTISAYINDRVTFIGSAAFCSCTSLTTISCPAATYIGSSAFYECSKLKTAGFPAAISIYFSAFFNCTSLTTASFPAARTIYTAAFFGCKSLTTISFPSVTDIYASAFYSCNKLTTAYFPLVTSLSSNVFYNCSSLTTASFPKIIYIGSYAFNKCSNLTTTSFPLARFIYNGAFSGCSKLTTISFTSAASIDSNVFKGCFNLKALYLTRNVPCTLTNSNAFSSTPIGGYSTSAGTYGSIYVPASLLTSYQTATNWTYFSSRFVGI